MSVDVELVSKCGLFCGECGKFTSGKCAGCGKNDKATWCKIRSCCIENNYQSCAECKTFNKHNECEKFNNVFSKLFGFIFGTDRVASIKLIQANGYENYAKKRREDKRHAIKRR